MVQPGLPKKSLRKASNRDFSSVGIGLILVLQLWILAGSWGPPSQQEDAKHRSHPSSNTLSSLSKQRVIQDFNALTNEQIGSLVRAFTMVGPIHLRVALSAIDQLNENGIEGDIVECGVWKGGMTMGMILINQRTNTKRNFWLFDTFEGLPEPASEKNGPYAKKLYKDIENSKLYNITSESLERVSKDRGVQEGKWNYGPYDVVMNNVLYTGYPKEKIHLVKGKVEDTLTVESNLPKKIALLRLDTDWYESTKIELETLYDRLQPGGLLLLDDYCIWPGSKSATKEFFSKHLGISEPSEKPPCLHYWKPVEK